MIEDENSNFAYGERRSWDDLEFQEEQGQIVGYWSEIEATQHYEKSVAAVAKQELPSDSARATALNELLSEDPFCKERLDMIKILKKETSGSASESIIVGV